MNKNRMKAYLLSYAVMFLALPGCGPVRPTHPDDPLRLITKDDLCIGVPVYANPETSHHVGELVVISLIPYGSEQVRAVNISVVVDGEKRSLWRREEEVMNWYVRADHTNCPKEGERDYRGTFFDESLRSWTPTNLEFSLDDNLWLRRDGPGWSSTQGRHTTGFQI